jgi:hypothetical protein
MPHQEIHSPTGLDDISPGDRTYNGTILTCMRQEESYDWAQGQAYHSETLSGCSLRILVRWSFALVTVATVAHEHEEH